MATITIQDARTKLVDLIRNLQPGDEIIITENDRPVARVTSVSGTLERKLGTLKGTVQHMSEDFDAPLDEFREYTQ